MQLQHPLAGRVKRKLTESNFCRRRICFFCVYFYVPTAEKPDVSCILRRHIFFYIKLTFDSARLFFAGSAAKELLQWVI
jgi:hypothetical protein